MPHVVLLFLVAAEDADLSDVGLEQAVDDGVSKGARSPRN